jgi:hypothetical protein
MLKIAVFWDVAPCSLVEVYAIALRMEAARTSETLVNFYQTTRCYNPEDSNLHTHRRENLKSYLWDSSLYNTLRHHVILVTLNLHSSRRTRYHVFVVLNGTTAEEKITP